MIPIVPAIIPTSSGHLVSTLAHLGFSPEVHVDVVDGVFVQSVSWPYTPAGDPNQIKPVTDGFTLEVDLMVQNPLEAADVWVAAGADMLVFHIETISLEAFKRFAESTKISLGVCALNDTPLETLLPYLEVADYVQVMGIAAIGAQGQPLDERVFERIKTLKESNSRLLVSVDGSVNGDTISRLAKVGVDRFICGSAIAGATNPKEAHAYLSSLIN